MKDAVHVVTPGVMLDLVGNLMQVVSAEAGRGSGQRI